MKPRPAAARRPIMTTMEVADYLRVHYTTLYRLIRRGEIPCFKVGRDHRFRRDEIEQWIAEKQRPR
jgi:putative molybdopterin biosynthesis protein